MNVLRVNVEEDDENSLAQRFGENYNLIHKKGDTFKTIMNESQNYDLVLMGDLRYTVMVERITGKLELEYLKIFKNRFSLFRKLITNNNGYYSNSL